MDQNPFQRLEVLLGKDAVQRLANSFVIICGMGAVGSYATEALARAGIGKLRLIDFDDVRLSNINRQLFALHSTMGKAKCEIAKDRVLDINPNCQVEAVRGFIAEETIAEFLSGNPDMVIDAIDSLNSKATLLDAAKKMQLPLLASMGAALRRDPSLIRIGNLPEVRNCPLARLLKKRLKNRNADLNIRCVYSIEPDNPHAIMTLEDSDPHDLQAFNRGRLRRPMGSMSTVTGIFGLLLAHDTINKITA
ncbi:MAG: tRNA threonylcarbamoyladenosine dehydratase [Deltaproteobacteria bacterium]|nr:tRNA threonylcarbamoyladenosine dehydratase [Deltaproteobacteria bacterium]